MKRHPTTQDDDAMAWSRQEMGLLAAFVFGGVLFLGAMFYALGVGRDSTQVAGVTPSPAIGERIPAIPRLE